MPTTRYIIQLDLPTAAGRALGEAEESLRAAGVELDATYRPVCINPKLQRFVVRGLATPEARAAAEEIRGVQFFADAPVQAASRKSGISTAV